MQAAATPALPPPRRRVYTAVDPRCEWRSTEDADTLVVDVSGFRKEELKVLYNTRRKLKVTGERQADGVPKLKVTGERPLGGGQWARFLKVFPVPRSCDAGTIQAKLNTESAQLFVVVPKRKRSSSSKDEQEGHHPERAQSLQELMRAEDTEDGSSGTGNGKAEDKEQKQHHQDMEEPRKDQVMNIQDLPRGDGDATENAARNDGGATENAARNDGDATENAARNDGGATENAARNDGDATENAARNDSDATENAARNNDGDGDGRWWRKIRALHVLGFVLVLALVGVGATVLYIVLM